MPWWRRLQRWTRTAAFASWLADQRLVGRSPAAPTGRSRTGICKYHCNRRSRSWSSQNLGRLFHGSQPHQCFHVIFEPWCLLDLRWGMKFLFSFPEYHSPVLIIHSPPIFIPIIVPWFQRQMYSLEIRNHHVKSQWHINQETLNPFEFLSIHQSTSRQKPMTHKPRNLESVRVPFYPPIHPGAMLERQVRTWRSWSKPWWSRWQRRTRWPP